METLAIVLALIFIGQVIDLRGEIEGKGLSLMVTAAAFLGALAVGIHVAVTA